MVRTRTALVAIALLCLGSAAMADDAPVPLKPLDRPDPAGITVPALAFSPTSNDAAHYDDYFYFQKPGVTYAAAFADLDECRLYSLAGRVAAIPPKFVAMGSDPVAEDVNAEMTNAAIQYGPVGMMLISAIMDEVRQDIIHATIRRCMAYKGYSRYGLPEYLARQLDDGTDAQQLARRALIASGPQPAAEAIGP